MKVHLASVGCRLNQSEIETMARQLLRAGHEIVLEPGEAELTIINTCTVTHKAASDSRQVARHAAREGTNSIILTGCWATLEPEAALSLPNIDSVISNEDKDKLILNEIDPASLDEDPIQRSLLTELLGRTRAFIKVQDGCDNHCTFCLTTHARGKSRSIPLASVIAEINEVITGGAQEIVLTGVQLGSWGSDLPQASHLIDLLSAIIQYTDTPRIRLSSVEPWSIDHDFFDLWENPRLCRHLHLPLQSGAPQTLRKMARRNTIEEYEDLILAARQAIPNLAITTDVIVGFPGEDETVFSESAAFVERMQFSGGHVFTYSPRPGTTAATFNEQCDPKLSKFHSQKMRTILSDAARQYQKSFLGATLQVLWEQRIDRTNGKWSYKGLTDNYMRVIISSDENLWNKITDTTLVAYHEDALIGEIIQTVGTA